MKKLNARAQILKIIDTMPEYQLQVFLSYIQALQKIIENDARKLKAEVIIQHMQEVPEEDYELSSEERSSIERSREAVRRGEHQSLESVIEELRHRKREDPGKGYCLSSQCLVSSESYERAVMARRLGEGACT